MSCLKRYEISRRYSVLAFKVSLNPAVSHVGSQTGIHSKVCVKRSAICKTFGIFCNILFPKLFPIYWGYFPNCPTSTEQSILPKKIPSNLVPKRIFGIPFSCYWFGRFTWNFRTFLGGGFVSRPVVSSSVMQPQNYFSTGYGQCQYPAYNAAQYSNRMQKSGSCPVFNTLVACPMLYTSCRTGCKSDNHCRGRQKCCQTTPCGTDYSCQRSMNGWKRWECFEVNGGSYVALVILFQFVECFPIQAPLMDMVANIWNFASCQNVIVELYENRLKRPRHLPNTFPRHFPRVKRGATVHSK